MNCFLRVAAAAVLAAASLPAAVATAGCPPEPRALCRDFARSSLVVEASGRFEWRAGGGPASSLDDFGDAEESPSLLCAYDDRGLVVAADIPAGAECPGGSCWSLAGESALDYRDVPGALGDIRRLGFVSSEKDRTKLEARVEVIGGINLPLGGRVTVQLTRGDSPVCFEGTLFADSLRRNDRGGASGRYTVDDAEAVPPLAGPGCGASPSPYASGATTADWIGLEGIERTFRVHVPTSYRADVPAPLVVLLHGSRGSGAGIEASSRMAALSEAEGFVLVSPDGVRGAGGARSWNSGACCGAAAAAGVDDVGFVGAVVDMVGWTTCIDQRRIYVAGASEGAMLADRVACELADRVRAVASTARGEETAACDPARPVPALPVGAGPFDGAAAWDFFSANPVR